MKQPPNEVNAAPCSLPEALARIGDITIRGHYCKDDGVAIKATQRRKTSQRPEFRRVARIPKILTPSVAANFCRVDSKVRRRARRHFHAGRGDAKSWGKANCVSEVA